MTKPTAQIPEARLAQDFPQEKKATLKMGSQNLEMLILENDSIIHFREHAERLKKEIALNPTPELQDELNRRIGPGAESARQGVLSKLHEHRSAEFEPLLLECFAEAERIVSGYRSEAIAAEKGFCADFGVNYTPGSVSRKFDGLLATIRAYRADLSSQRHVVIPPHNNPLLALLGIDLENI